MSLLLPIYSLIHRELIRFFRQRSRVIGTFGTAVIFWVLLGSGFGKTFQLNALSTGMGYLEYFFPGAIMMVVLFTSIFSNISIIEDRNLGFLQSVLVAPVHRLSIPCGKVLGGVIFSLLQSSVFLIFAPFVGYSIGIEAILFIVLSVCLTSFVLGCLGFIFAWKLNSVQGFHGIMNLVLFPMWLLSSSLFPVSSASLWLKTLMYLNPLLYGISIMRYGLHLSGSQIQIPDGPPLPLSIFILALFSIVLGYLATKTVKE